MNSFTVYKEYYELITLLTEKEQQELLLAIFKYMFEDIEPSLNDRQMKIFNNLKRPLKKSKKRSQNSSKTETKQNQNKNETETKQKRNENEKKTHQDVNVNVNNNVLEKEGYGERKPLVTVDSNSLLEITKKVITHLNQKTESNFKYTSKNTQDKIKARLNEGYKLDDFIIVIDKKVDEWLNNDEFSRYLCPETLFGTKFEKYLNQKVKKHKIVWFGKKIEEKTASADEIREINEILKKYD